MVCFLTETFHLLALAKNKHRDQRNDYGSDEPDNRSDIPKES
jgi:hypothetical protein